MEKTSEVMPINNHEYENNIYYISTFFYGFPNPVLYAGTNL